MPTQTEISSLEAVRAAELEEARHIQQAMLPTEYLHGPNFEFVHRCCPVSEVGGDFLDYFMLNDHRVGFYIGDVVGKGLPAAMYAALTVGALRGMHKSGTQPSTVLGILNDRLRMRIVPGRYCSVLYAVFDPKTLELRVSSAGMPRPILLSGGGCREFGDGGLPSGLFENVTYDQVSLKLAPGDAVLFTTDGLTDARDADDEDFGHARFLSLCSTLAGQPAEAVLREMFSTVESFSHTGHHQDDMTAAVLRVL